MKIWLYGVPAVPAGSEFGDTVIIGQFTESVTDTDPEQPPGPVAVTVIGNEPDCVGVPESSPVAVLNVMPVGSVPVRLHVTVPVKPVCEKIWL